MISDLIPLSLLSLLLVHRGPLGRLLACFLYSTTFSVRLHSQFIALVIAAHDFANCARAASGASSQFTWRFACAFAAVPGLIAFRFRLKMHETKKFAQMHNGNSPQHSPATGVCFANLRARSILSVPAAGVKETVALTVVPSASVTSQLAPIANSDANSVNASANPAVQLAADAAPATSYTSDLRRTLSLSEPNLVVIHRQEVAPAQKVRIACTLLARMRAQQRGRLPACGLQTSREPMVGASCLNAVQTLV